ncbi:GGDEF domain-containing protein [Kangiella profundi]|uniref:diguanylate cyclase n=1 Tax=Kangiella profundi TaxID=1561924 RepID=A0A2K9APC1_9GAMM|nr:sensor domain-containing diguanylate cyclase [Kangiella profundi]AUD79472.1 GGDEF domain-containing protein [Kangiella profundi]GGE98187.1 GGDEF domain-containing protein [Kangiella profundi]
MNQDQIKHNAVKLVASGYIRLLLTTLALLPILLILYIDSEIAPDDVFIAHTFHVIAITMAVLVSAFLSYITWRCYVATGEVLLKWLVFGFWGFTIVYAPHGFLTHHGADNVWLFVLFGPASRLVLSFCFLVAMLKFGEMIKPEQTTSKGLWVATAIFVVISVAIYWVAKSTSLDLNWWLLLAEYVSLSMFIGSVLWMLVQRIRGYIPLLYSIAMVWFALSCWSFSIATVWDHQWWLAHIIFAAGFLLLSYGVVQAFLTTGSFKTIYSQSDLFKQIIQEKKKTERALQELQQVNQKLEQLAATDSLTGIANRREFMNRAEEEISRANRNGTDLSMMVIDFDQFKNVNDEYGHQAGDKVLKEFVRLSKEIMRPSDLLGRIGGEEFALLLPETELSSSIKVAERLREYIEDSPVTYNNQTINLTISIGLAQYQPKVDTVKKWLHRADQLLYQAKDKGRNRVEVERSEGDGE